jgi:serine/threonine protein kinase
MGSFKERWIRKESLSGGGQGDVFLVTDSAGEHAGLWVQKRLRNLERIERFKKEVRAGLELSHPNVIRVIDHDLEAKRPYLVTEFCSGGSLRDARLSDYSVVDRLRTFSEIALGVAHAHDKGIVHRDLKPDNIFLREGRTPVVGDFGLCFLADDGERVTLLDEAIGPRMFVAPELEDGLAEQVGPWSDTYSLGKLLYWLASGGRVFAREKHKEPKFDLRRETNDPAVFFIYELLDKMILREPGRRLRDASYIPREVDTAIRRILMGAHPIDLRVPQQCSYCGVGNYEVIDRGTKYQEFVPSGSPYDFGPLARGTNYLFFACNHCGNLQMFHPQYAKDPGIWIRS